MTSLENHIKTLAEIVENENHFLSVYVPNPLSHQQFVGLLNRLTEMQRAMGKAYKAEMYGIVEKLKELAAKQEMEKSPGVAYFIRTGDAPFSCMVPLPKSVETEVVLDTLPKIFPLVEMKDVYQRYAVVMLTQVSARIIQVNAGQVTASVFTGSLDLRSRVGREISKDRYANHQKQRGEKFIKEKVGVLEEIIKEHQLNHIILAGDLRMTTKFKELLPAHLAKLVIDETVVGNIQSFEEVVQSSISAFIAAEESESIATVDRLRYQVAKNGLVCTGHAETLQALEEFRLDLLVISKSCVAEISEPLVRLAIQQEIEIETVEDSDFIDSYDGVAGFLRYKKYN